MKLVHDPHKILARLKNAAHVALTDLPATHGLYGLRDHTGEIRYIGITESLNMGFRKRINNYHAAGDEIHSHKFSRAYCTGRMWRDRKLLNKRVGGVTQLEEHAKSAKALRRRFIRLYCSASFVEIPRECVAGDYFNYLEALETAVKQIAPDSMGQWDGHSFAPVPEPSDLVDKVIARGKFSEADIAAFDAQKRLYLSITQITPN